MPSATRTWPCPCWPADQAQTLGARSTPARRGSPGSGRGWRRGPVQLLQCLDHRERRRLHPGPGVGGIAGGDLGVDQGPQQFLGRPPLGLRGDQQPGGELPIGQLERRSPAAMSGASGGAAAAVMTGRRSRSRPAGDRDGLRSRISASPAGPGLGARPPGGQDRPHVSGPPPAERDRPVQRGQELLRRRARRAACSARPGPRRAGCSRRGGAGDERLGDRAERAELLLRRGLRPHRPAGRGPRAAVTLIAHGGLTGATRNARR